MSDNATENVTRTARETGHSPEPTSTCRGAAFWQMRRWLPITVPVVTTMCLLLLVRTALPSRNEHADLIDAVTAGNTAAGITSFRHLRDGCLIQDRWRVYEDMGAGFNYALRAGRAVPESEIRAYLGSPDFTSTWLDFGPAIGYSYDKHGQKDGMLYFWLSQSGTLTQVGIGVPLRRVIGATGPTGSERTDGPIMWNPPK